MRLLDERGIHRSAAFLFMALAGFGPSVVGAAGSGSENPSTWVWRGNGTLDHDSLGWRRHVHRDPLNRAAWSPDGGRRGSGALSLARRSRDTVPDFSRIPSWMTVIDSVPVGHRLRFGAWVRGRDCVLEPWINLGLLSADGTQLSGTSVRHEPRLAGDYDWIHLEGTVPVHEGSVRAELVALFDGGGEVWFDDFSIETAGVLSSEERKRLEPSASPLAPVDRGGLFLVRNEERITRLHVNAEPSSKHGVTGDLRVTVAMPSSDSDQVPLAYDLWSEPPAGILGAEIREDRPGNFVADVRLKAPSGSDSILFKWSALVLVKPKSFATVPLRAAIPASWPSEAAPWLRASRCAESEDPAIRAAAARLRSGTDDVLEIARRTVGEVTRTIRAQEGLATVFDAVQALEKKGSCLSNAHLATALLRANGIPARSVSCVPTWGGPVSAHFIVELWVPDYGWYPIEPTRGFAPWPPSQQIRLSVVPVDYEDRGVIRAPGEGAPCLPYLSIAERSVVAGGVFVLGIADRTNGVSLSARAVGDVGRQATPAQWERAVEGARSRWALWRASQPSLTHGHLGTPRSSWANIDALRLEEIIDR